MTIFVAFILAIIIVQFGLRLLCTVLGAEALITSIKFQLIAIFCVWYVLGHWLIELFD